MAVECVRYACKRAETRRTTDPLAQSTEHTSGHQTPDTATQRHSDTAQGDTGQGTRVQYLGTQFSGPAL